jgi:hypothetical protein
VRAQRGCERALLLGPPGHPDPHAGGAAELDQRGGDPAGGALDQHGLARAQAGLHEQHAVGGQPGGAHARGLGKRQAGRLGQDVAGWHRDHVGERALVPFGEQGAPRVEGLVAGPARGDDDGMQHDLAAVLEHAGAVAAEDHRELVGLDPDPAQRPQVVHVQARGPHGHGHPAVLHLGRRPLTHAKRGERAVRVGLCGIHGEHARQPIRLVS